MLAAPDGAAAEGMAKKTRAKRWGGASRGSDAGPGTVPDPQAPDRSRCAIGQDTTGRQETDWPGGSNLVRHPRGSNGGVHRGSDRCLRKNVMEGVLLRAMIREGVHLSVTPAGGRRVHRSKISAAMVENLVTRLQLIVLQGSDADVLRLVAIMNDVFKQDKNGKNGSGDGPFPATFIRPPASTGPDGGQPPPPSTPGTLLDANGQQYVE